MKRSEINDIIRKFENVLAAHRFVLPPYLFFTPEEWQEKDHEYDEIRDNMLGWDVTDYGSGDFASLGLALITIRNGNAHNSKYPKPYAEKLLMAQDGQSNPIHFHLKKMEDIINRGGGNIIFRLYNVTEEGKQADTDVDIFKDGRKYTVSAGAPVILYPGESLTLYPNCYHGFTIEPGSGVTLIGEISTCNDDKMDNRYLEQIVRFPAIKEDEIPYRLLCREYPPAAE